MTQAALASRAGVSRDSVSAVERGRASSSSIALLRAIAAALDARVVLTVRWQGGDLERMVNRRHAALHEVVARMFARLDAWTVEPEVSFSIYGERGVIDVLAWHAGSRALLVVELKTEIVDINELMGSVDRKRRLAERIAHDRGWAAGSVSTWIAIADVRTNRRALALHAATLRAKFPADGRAMRAWLRDPRLRMDALGFVRWQPAGPTATDLAPVRRVRPRAPPTPA